MMGRDVPIIPHHTPNHQCLEPVGRRDRTDRRRRRVRPRGGRAGAARGRHRRPAAAPSRCLLSPVGSTIHVHPDHQFDVVLARFPAADGALPVVSRADANRIEGVITLDSIIAAVAPQTRRPPTG